MAVYELFVDQYITFDQSNSKNNPIGASASNTLIMYDSAKNYRKFVPAGNTLYFQQIAKCRKSIINVTVTDFIDFHHGGFKAAASQQDVVQLLVFDQVARPVEYEIVEQTLDIQQDVVVIVATPAFNTLVMSQTVTVTTIRNIEVVQTLIITSGSTGVLEDEDFYSISLPTLTGPNAPECS